MVNVARSYGGLALFAPAGDQQEHADAIAPALTTSGTVTFSFSWTLSSIGPSFTPVVSFV